MNDQNGSKQTDHELEETSILKYLIESYSSFFPNDQSPTTNTSGIATTSTNSDTQFKNSSASYDWRENNQAEKTDSDDSFTSVIVHDTTSGSSENDDSRNQTFLVHDDETDDQKENADLKGELKF